jgi:endonuclease YncB( thermonuclease family)
MRLESNRKSKKGGDNMKCIVLQVMSFGMLIVNTCWATSTLNYQTTVLDVIDGNTIVISNKVFKHGIQRRSDSNVELDGIATPRIEQLGGKEAKAFLERLVKGKSVNIIELTDQDRSRGAWVFVGPDEVCVNLRLVEEGHAWLVDPRAHYAVSMGKPKEAYGKLKTAFQKAKEKKRGIWADDNPVPPWEWIKNHPKKDEAQPKEGGGGVIQKAPIKTGIE